MKRISVKIMCLMFLVSPVKAQDNQALDGYTPPPLFGNSKPVQKTEPKKKIIYKKPEATKPIKLKPIVTKIKPVKPAIIAPKVVLEKPPKPAAKPIKQIAKKVEPPKIVEKIVEKPTEELVPVAPKMASKIVMDIKAPPEPVEPVIVPPPVIIQQPKKIVKAPQEPSERFLEPIHLRKDLEIPAKTTVAKKKTVAKASSLGVVKGPKTMPAVQKAGVEAEVLFEPESIEQVAILDRVQKAPEPKKTKVEPVNIDTNTAQSFDVSIQGQKNITLPYSNAKVILGDEHKAILLQVSAEFKKHNIDTVNITAYASKSGDALSSDKRISLSRALEVRNFLVSQGVEARYIKVRALGAETDKTPIDRVELNLPNS